MTTICVDTSFVVRLITISPATNPTYSALWQQWLEAEVTLVAPSLFLYEVTNALYRYVVANTLTLEESSQLLQAVFTLPITLYQDNELHQRSLVLAQENSLPATYDAHYLALAERLNAELWTCDRRLFNKVHTAFSQIHLLE
ncbi:type II toxin-antitoxin system VapC family toxin [Phormidesmis sp. 146-35]